jgi:formylglycine-generating enzyme required for sulfatase activity
MKRIALLLGVGIFSTLILVPVAMPETKKPVGKRYAILVGVNEYKHSKLPALKYAVNDATDLKKLLEAGGYLVTLLTNETETKPTRAAIDAAIHEVLGKAEAGDTVVLAFAGHGLQFKDDKDSYFCPIDARPFKDETKTLISMGVVYREMEKSFAGVKVLLVDACRDDPDEGRGSRGIDADSAPRPPRGVAAFFSCSAKQKAFEHDSLKHGVFFHYMLEGLKGKAKNDEDDVTFNSLVDYVGRNVEKRVPQLYEGAQQQPNQKADLSGRSPVLLALSDTKPVNPKVEPKPGEERSFDVGNGVKMKFCWIPETKGKVKLGSPVGEKKREDDETEHEVELDGFWMAKYTMTQSQYVKLTGKKNPSRFSAEGGGKVQNTDDFPVEQVSWDDAQECIKGMKVPEGMKRLGLPSEAQWEWAARGGLGNGRAFYWGDVLNGDKANCDGTFPYGTETKGAYLKRTEKVGSYEKQAPHPWGLCDISGNVYQWCEDYYGSYEKLPGGKNPVQTVKQSDNRRVLRGGSWSNNPTYCRSAYRDGDYAPDGRSSSSGFRAVVLP